MFSSSRRLQTQRTGCSQRACDLCIKLQVDGSGRTQRIPVGHHSHAAGTRTGRVSDFVCAAGPLSRRIGRNLETEMRGERWAYFVHAHLSLAAGTEKAGIWRQRSARIARRLSAQRKLASDPTEALELDMKANNANLEKIVASADGLQVSSDPLALRAPFCKCHV